MFDGSGNSQNKHLGQPWIPKRSMGLGRALQKAGFGTRAVTDGIVISGRVQVDGLVQVDPKSMVGPGSEIFLDNKRLKEVLPVFMALNKPLRVVCVPSDGVNCQLAMEFFPSDIPGLRPVGRMDSRSTGLLLVSNNKDWNNLLTDAKNLEHEYRVQVEGELSAMEVTVIEAGINLPKLGSFKPVSVQIVESMKGRTVLNIVLTDGKVRQLRKMFTTLRHKIFYLRRIRIGDIRLGYLAPGDVRDLSSREIQSIRDLT
ncbi:MAG: rRNA pseudouridine synthase [bacterium]|nr:rRNA pseudouridine synthase [bacterium]